MAGCRWSVLALIRILQGDCRDVLATLPDAAVQCCVTSPPYYGLRDYGVDGQIGLEQTPDEYVAQLVEVFRGVRRLLREDGTLWLNLGDSYAMSTKGAGGRGKQHTNNGSVMQDRRWQIPQGIKPKDLLGIPWRVAFALQADSWWLRSAIVWHKPNPMPESVTDRPTSAYEMVFLLAKSARYFFDAEAIQEPMTESAMARLKSPRYQNSKNRPDVNYGNPKTDEATRARQVASGMRNSRNVWTIATQPYSEAHFATFPPELAERCIKAGTSEKGCCAKCGAPWVRVVEKGEPDWEHRAACGADTSGGYNGQSTKGHDTAGVQNASDVKRRILEGMRLKTFDWSASCRCDAPTQPCIVLDPFAGAGTTLLVADRLHRNSIGIELNPTYADMARRRISDDAGMFASVA
jgi:DNA modification methylase